MAMINLEWLVPIVILLVWIVSNVLRGGDEEAPAGKARPGNPARPRVPRQPTTDIDRFLAEVNRRRQQTMERRQQPAEEETAQVRRPSAPQTKERIPVVEPVARPPLRQTAVDRPKPKPRVQPSPAARAPVSAPRPAREEAVTVVEVVSPSQSMRSEPGRAFPDALQPDSRFPGAAPVFPGPTADQMADSTGLPGPAMQQLRVLLRTPQSMQTAIILHEIFGPPLAQRRRRA